MSDFIVIVPPGWTQLDWEYISNNVPNMSAQDVNNGVVSDIETWLKEGGQIPADSSLVDFKLIDDAYFLVKLG
jgi:hypothetical protein